jgi:hypothetical protein
MVLWGEGFASESNKNQITLTPITCSSGALTPGSQVTFGDSDGALDYQSNTQINVNLANLAVRLAAGCWTVTISNGYSAASSGPQTAVIQ